MEETNIWTKNRIAIKHLTKKSSMLLFLEIYQWNKVVVVYWFKPMQQKFHWRGVQWVPANKSKKKNKKK